MPPPSPSRPAPAVRRRPSRRSFGVVTLVVCVAALSACSYETTGLAPELPEVAQTSQLFAADGTLLTTLRAEQNREVVRLADMPKALRDAVVAIEDDRFWVHRGVDLRAILRAARADASAGGVSEGGSTITQQYVKTALLDPSQTVNRKVREAVLAWRLERAYSKEVILERYLNTIYFGHGAYGAAVAAQDYFGKPVAQLDLAESALLAGLIQAPSATDPFVRPDLAVARRNVVLDRMLQLGLVERAAHDAAWAEPLQLAPDRPATERYPAAHFVEAVKQWILTDPRFGASDDARRNLLFKGGLRIATTLDLRLQAAAERAVGAVLTDPGTSPEGAVVAVEPQTGYVRAMVGGRDYFGDSPYAKVNLALGDGRQAGSTFKPFVLAAALDQGIPLTRTYQAPARIDIPLGPGTPPWEVHNYGGGAGGTVSLTEATVWSYNTAYAKLMMDVGPGPAVDMANRLGVQSPLQPVPSAVLGTQNVTVLDMASAYATFANRGQHVAPVMVTTITRADGSVLYENRPAVTAALRSDVADQVNWVLRQVIERGTGTGAQLDRPAAGKTGTAEGYRDAWFVGYTPDLAAAVWVGFAQGQVPMSYPTTPIQVTGGSWPADIWQHFMTAASEGRPIHDFTPPEPVTLRRIEPSRRPQAQSPGRGSGADEAPTTTTTVPGGPGTSRAPGPPSGPDPATTAAAPGGGPPESGTVTSGDRTASGAEPATAPTAPTPPTIATPPTTATPSPEQPSPQVGAPATSSATGTGSPPADAANLTGPDTPGAPGGAAGQKDSP